MSILERMDIVFRGGGGGGGGGGQALVPTVDLNISRSNLTPYSLTRLILCVHQANKRHRYKITPSLIGWVQT